MLYYVYFKFKKGKTWEFAGTFTNLADALTFAADLEEHEGKTVKILKQVQK